MSSSTQNYSLPYPAVSDPPDGASQIQALAAAVDTVLAQQLGSLQGQLTAIGQPMSSRKAAAQAWPAGNGMTGDPDVQLTFSDPAGVYRVNGIVRYDADASAQYRFRFVPPAGAVFYYVTTYRSSTGNVAQDSAPSSNDQAAGETVVSCWGAGQNSLLPVVFDGILVMGGSTGVLQYQACNVTGGGAYGWAHYLGSFMRTEKISG